VSGTIPFPILVVGDRKGACMGYDELLATRIRAVLGPLPYLEEKKMFGGVGFLVNGNMACGVHKDDMIVRVGGENYEEALSRPNTHIFDMTGRPMVGWIMVKPEGCSSESDLKAWVEQGLAYARCLPAKEK
jgi:TfoX/Sxy family transcriptional regulator of competence genes